MITTVNFVNIHHIIERDRYTAKVRADPKAWAPHYQGNGHQRQSSPQKEPSHWMALPQQGRGALQDSQYLTWAGFLICTVAPPSTELAPHSRACLRSPFCLLRPENSHLLLRIPCGRREGVVMGGFELLQRKTFNQSWFCPHLSLQKVARNSNL